MKNRLAINNKLKFIIIFSLFLSLQTTFSQDSKPLLIKTLTDTSLKTRGIIVPDEGDFRIDYDDIDEVDTQAPFLQEKGFHGGGPSWLGIIYGALTICESDLLNNLDSDVSTTGLSFWSSKKEELEIIGRIIYMIKSDDKILLEATEIAKQNDMML